MKHHLSLAFGLTITLLCSGCNGARSVQTRVLLTYENCQTLTAAITEVRVEQVAKIRGSRLLTLPPKGTQPASQQTATTSSEPGYQVFAISTGQKPTPGYSLEFDSAQLQEQTLTVQVQAAAPSAERAQVQMTTHPCLVIAMPRTSATQLIVRSDAGEIGRLPLTPSATEATRD